MTPIQWEKLSETFILLTAILGCIIQMRSTFIAYFTYDTITKTTYVIPKHLELMSLSLCSPYAEILDYKSLKKIKKIDLSNLTRDERYWKNQELLTVRELFILTPRNDSILYSCGTRLKSKRGRSFSESKKAKCDEMFGIEKYYTQEYMCYLVTPKQIFIPYTTITNSIDYPGVVYRITLDYSVCNLLKFIKLIVHSNGLPDISKLYSPFTRLPKPNETEFKIRYLRHFVHYIGYPYDRFTCSNEHESYHTCLEQCANRKAIAKFQKILYDLNTKYPYDYRHISVNDVTNPSIAQDIDDILDDCDQQCMQRSCDIDYTMTSYDRADRDSLWMTITAPDAPEISIRFQPSIKLLDLFVYVMGAVGTWFGVAFININLISVHRWVKSKLNRRNQSNDVPLNRYSNVRRNNRTHLFWWCRVNDPRTLAPRRIRMTYGYPRR